MTTARQVGEYLFRVALQWAMMLAFCSPLRRRPHFWRHAAAGLVPLAAFAAVNHLPYSPAPALLSALASFFVAGAVVHSCVELNASGSLYCGIWSVLVPQLVYELWWLLQSTLGLPWWLLPALGASLTTLAYFTLARIMPDNGTYDIGPRQFTSALVLGTMFSYMFARMFHLYLAGGWPNAITASMLLCQLYCISLIYLQTELFKKSAMQKELDALNLLYERQREQYQVARQNVQIINSRCHELKVRIAALRRAAPEEVPPESLDEAEHAARLYDAAANTGNEVLDVVLTEKSLLADSRRVQINAVADGSCLAGFEPGDLYALFANALDYMIASAVGVNDPAHRVIDLLVCVRQNFVLINVIGPERPPTAAGRAADYEEKMVRKLVQKYDGTLTAETKNGFYALKIIFPQKKRY